MTTLLLLQNIIRCISPRKLQIWLTNQEVIFTGIKEIEMQIQARKTVLPNSYVGSIEGRASDFLRLFRECKLFSDIDFLRDKEVAQVTVEEGEYVLYIDCPFKTREAPELIEPEQLVLVDLNIEMIKNLAVYDAKTAQFTFTTKQLKITISGTIQSESLQHSPKYLQADGLPALFITTAASISALVAICQLDPERVVLGVNKTLAVFRFYFPDLTLTLYSQGTLLPMG
ncbi:hypothetical protein NEHOM01_0636 [Nematocida homosporus]|uniref:uncharacterized protein n=1 Tax=Nematocida homosporus TaxID=1912981 RepID=UPI00221F2A2F|nr:uncharacterized protein NEHOM01_0636 [Nematocida homosporus]KAI5185131.1 hypothetical protein NEHOM01_0636 [Nematocida homosporus]